MRAILARTASELSNKPTGRTITEPPVSVANPSKGSHESEVSSAGVPGLPAGASRAGAHASGATPDPRGTRPAAGLSPRRPARGERGHAVPELWAQRRVVRDRRLR